MHVLATAGHVDHGKSSLLRQLTGMEPSRLPEERKRGMTMQLGYVWLTDAEGRPVGIVDVPGHADYRIAMLSGVSAVDAFLFVCAADDGWMPQSEEHLWALKTFGVKNGVVVVTKTDLVSPERVADVKAECEVRFYEALGREVNVIAWSATQDGAQLVKAALDRELALLPEAKDQGRPMMFVDRVFTAQGQGTVVTGTLRDGTLGERQRVELIPSGRTAPIRSIQTYGKSVLTARPNCRVALQLAGIEVVDVPKETQIALSGRAYTTNTVDILFSPFQGYTTRGKKPPEVVVVHGGVRTKAVLKQMGGGYARLELACRRWLRFEERLLIVSSGLDRILGGGAVLDEAPVRGIRKAAERLPLIEDFSIEEYLTLQIAKGVCIRQGDVELRTRFAQEELEEAYEDLKGCFVYLDDWISDAEHVERLQEKIVALLTRYHVDHPEEEGLPESKLAKRIAVPDDFLRQLLRALKRAKKISQVGPYLKLATHVPRVDRTSAVVQKLESFAASQVQGVWSMFDLGVNDDAKRRILARFVADGKFVRMDEKHVMSTPVYRTLVDKVLALMEREGPISAAVVRDRLGVGRKIVIMLLEAMDAEGLTRRMEERRGLADGRARGATAATSSAAPAPEAPTPPAARS